MATTNTRYVDPNAEVGGDGTTDALTGANCAYVSLSVWEAARQADLPTGDIIERVVCSSDDAGSTHLADTTACTLDGWTTDATRYIQIEAASSHGGKWNDAIYRLSTATTALVCAESYIRLYGVQVLLTASSGTLDGLHIQNVEGGVTILSKCIIRAAFTGSAIGVGVYIWANSGTRTTYVQNSLIYDFINTNYCFGVEIYFSAADTVYVQNCTIQNCQYGSYNLNGTFHTNNVGYSGCTNPETTITSSTTNSTTTPTFVDGDNDDFHLAVGDTTWRGNGTDLSATFTDDIDGDTRSAWDIGCDEYVAAAVASHKNLMLMGVG